MSPATWKVMATALLMLAVLGWFLVFTCKDRSASLLMCASATASTLSATRLSPLWAAFWLLLAIGAFWLACRALTR